MASTPNTNAPRIALVTVGSTSFNALITAVLSSTVLSTLSNIGFTDIRFQYGDGKAAYDALVHSAVTKSPLRISGFDYTNSIRTEVAKAELVISHAGAGSILDGLRYQKRLVAVPNESLMDNHQVELAEEMELQGYLVWGKLDNLSSAIQRAITFRFAHLPRTGSHKFAEILDEELALADDLQQD